MSIAQLPAGTTPSAADLVGISQGGTDKAVALSAFAAGLTALPNVDVSRFTVTAAGGTNPVTLAAFAANTIPKSGGVVQGPLLLGSGGGPNTTISAGVASVFQWGYNQTSCNLQTQVAGSSPTTPSPTSFHCLFESTHSGGTPARIIAGAGFDCSISNDYGGPGGALVDGPATNHWALGATTYSDAVAAASAAGTAGSQHGGMYSQFVRIPPRGGYPAGKVGAQGWGLWLVVDDQTGQPSSIGGALTGIEMDMAAAGADDGAGRYGIQFNLSAATALGNGYCEFARFLYVNGYNQAGNQAWFQSILQLYAAYTVAAIDLSAGSQDVGNPMTGAANSAVAIKLRSGQKYGLNGDGLTGQYLTHDAQAAQTELWSGGRVIAAFPDAGGLVVKSMPKSPAGLPSGSLWNNGGAVAIVP